MATYNWILDDGTISPSDQPKSYYTLNPSAIEIFLHDALNQFNNSTTLNEIEDFIYEVNINQHKSSNLNIIVCGRGVTPGGRYPSEFRIQMPTITLNNAVDIAARNNITGVLLGIYKTKKTTEPIFCAWKLRKYRGDTPISRQVRDESIAKALQEGFTQVKTKNEYVCVFRKEFIFFYLLNREWLHEYLLEDLLEEQTPNKNIEELKRTGPAKPGINRIFHGAPGTGKSYGIKNFIQNHGLKNYNDNDDHPNVYRVTLHPEFGYNDFVGQIMPVTKKENETGSPTIEYEFSPQIFTLALAKAFSLREKGEPVFLILEEMSRANVASVFGDLFQLLDRNEIGISEYKINNTFISSYVFGEDFSEEKVYIPENLYIIGTVNTSDQNVFAMDTAFKRRFEFEYLNTNNIASNDDGSPKNNYEFRLHDQVTNETIEFSWVDFILSLNNFIVKDENSGGLGLSEDKQVGQFFINFKHPPSQRETDKEIRLYNENQIKGKLLQYLWNDVQKVSYSSHRLFSEDIQSFGQLYDLADENLNYFSKEFLDQFASSMQD